MYVHIRSLLETFPLACGEEAQKSYLVTAAPPLLHWDTDQSTQQFLMLLVVLWVLTVICGSVETVATTCFSPTGQSKGGEKGRIDSSSAESSMAASASTSSQSLPSFWVPSLTPEAKPTLLKKPVSGFSCHVWTRQQFENQNWSSFIVYKGEGDVIDRDFSPFQTCSPCILRAVLLGVLLGEFSSAAARLSAASSSKLNLLLYVRM